MSDERFTPADNPIAKKIGQPIFQVRGLTKYFDVGNGLRQRKLRALSDISFDLFRGECIALVGESGSGKSTVLKILSRLEQPSEGRIIFQGKDLLRHEPRTASLEYRSKVQMIFQDPFGSLNPVHTVRYHLARPLLRHKRVDSPKELEQQILSLLGTVGLSPPEEFAAKHPHQMSGGQRQRVAIARALAVNPAVMLADEPISMLDVSIRMGILNLMHDLKTATNVGYLYVTHDVASARYIADRTMVMYAGHMVEGGPTETILDFPRHPYTKLLLEAVPDPKGNIFRELPAKSGQPQLVDPPPGCPFADRCPEVLDVCRKKTPEPVRIRHRNAEGHFVRCHLYDDEAEEPDINELSVRPARPSHPVSFNPPSAGLVPPFDGDAPDTSRDEAIPDSSRWTKTEDESLDRTPTDPKKQS